VSVPRYLLSKAIGRIYRPIFWSNLSCLRYREVPEPLLPDENWAKIKVKYAGICASDMNLIYLRDSPSLSPFASSSFTIGHENLGYISELGEGVVGFDVGERVMAYPVLSCEARGFDEPCNSCQQGEFSRCERFAEGKLSPGMTIGACRETGGSWSPYFVAHKSQLIKVPEEVSDENAIMVDAFSSALHPVMRNYPKDSDKVLIIGAGVIGICTVIALRILGSKAHIMVLAKHAFQGKIAERYGADKVIYLRKGYFEEVAKAVGGKLYKPVLGKPVLVGGADVVYECVGKDDSIDDALRFTRAGGKMVLVGLAAVTKKVDWTHIWFKELEVRGDFYCSTEFYEGKRILTYQLALNFMVEGRLDLSPLLTHKFRLEDYKSAIKATANKAKSKLIKAVFFFD
jgi:threonine dehydrogenase-like Zn-dependent dehydrogenase